MPPKPLWYRRLGEIKGALRRIEDPVLDRTAIEQLFGVKKRQAIELMKEMDPELVGGAFVVPRERVAVFASAGQRTRAASIDHVRRVRVSEALEEARRDLAARAVKVPLSPTVRAATLDTLPETVRIERGELRILFTDAGELLQQLFALSQAIGRDFPAFERMLDREPPGASAPARARAGADSVAEPGQSYETGFPRGSATRRP